MKKNSTITIREENESRKVKIGSDIKPTIVGDVIDKWQSLIDTTAQIINVPSGLIMRLNEKTISVFIKSNTEGNPYELGEETNLGYGLFCETVIGTQDKLLVPDATKSDIWKKNNPDVDINMISYLGYPINWPDGEVFGTVCFLDNKENHYNELFSNLLLQVKNNIEADLKLLTQNEILTKSNQQLEILNNTKTILLSIISHDLRGKIGTANELMKLVITDFDDFDKLKLKTIFQSSSNSINSSFTLLEDLLVWLKADFLQLEPEKTEFDILRCFDVLIESFQLELKRKNIKIEKEYCNTNAMISADKNMFLVTFRNILSNALKYSNENGLIKIRILYSKKIYIIVIEDNGVGMNKTTVDNLFCYDRQHRTKGTIGGKSSGIGLMLAKVFVDMHDAKIDINSIVGLGTKVKITWPYNV